ncbi:MAG: hypothetical protein RSC28_07815 [Bacteroidales bacterium]
MPFVSEILKYRSLSIVGLDKNTGKTECLNYILGRLPLNNYKVAVTSIGVDGESVDQVTTTPKPEIYLREGIFFSTAELFYKSRRLVSELIDITDERSSLGRVVTAKVLSGGKVLLSGPSSGVSLRRWMGSLEQFEIDLCIVDGALSRLSSASPAISKAMVLSTGAAYSANLSTLVQKTKFVTELINIELADEFNIKSFINVENGVWGISKEGEVINFNLQSSLTLNNLDNNITLGNRVVYVSGALTDRFLKLILDSKEVKEIVLVVRDFTKIFVTEPNYRAFIKRGGRIRVLQKSKLIAVCVNPIAPNGYVLDSDLLCRKLEEAIKLPVYDIVKNSYDF